jgi:DNA-binding GntR family transcriptional regulator
MRGCLDHAAATFSRKHEPTYPWLFRTPLSPATYDINPTWYCYTFRIRQLLQQSQNIVARPKNSKIAFPRPNDLTQDTTSRFQGVDTLAEQAYNAIEELIMTATLMPNTFVSELKLSEDLGIGRTPVREALKRLEADGLVAIIPSRGIFVTEVDLKQQLMVLEVRRQLERLIAMRAARHATAAERKRFQELISLMQDAADTDDSEQFMRYDQEFNSLLDHAARNPIATKLMRPLRSMSRRFWFQNYSRQQESLKMGAKTHTAVMRAVADGNVEAAGKLMDELMDYVEDFAKSTINEFG